VERNLERVKRVQQVVVVFLPVKAVILLHVQLIVGTVEVDEVVVRRIRQLALDELVVQVVEEEQEREHVQH
jgi:DNA repair protein RadC